MDNICVCKCERLRKDEIFLSDRIGKYCPECGEKYKLVSPPILGILIHTGGENSCYEDEWITIKELKDLLKQEKS
uniref:Uncharacterized protein n=1 Tax=viral metagenome TaxID=1070528 RepID=A0A6H1Z724_9ZZZZ